MKKNLVWVVSAILGVLTLCFFAFPYISTHYLKQSTSINGYTVMGMWADGFSGGMLAFLQFAIWVCTVLLTILAVYKLIRDLIGKEDFDNFCGISVTGFGELLIITHAILQFFFMVFAVSHTVTYSGGGVRLAVNIGAILNFLLSIGSTVTYFILKLTKFK